MNNNSMHHVTTKLPINYNETLYSMQLNNKNNIIVVLFLIAFNVIFVIYFNRKYIIQQQIIWLILSIINIILIIINIYLLVVSTKNGIKISNRWFTINTQIIIIIIVIISISTGYMALLLNIFAQTESEPRNNEPGAEPQNIEPEAEPTQIKDYDVKMTTVDLVDFKIFNEKNKEQADENDQKISFYDIALFLQNNKKIQFTDDMTLFDFCKKYKPNISVINEENAKKALDILSYFCIQHVIKSNFVVFIYDISEIRNNLMVNANHVDRLFLYDMLLAGLISKLNTYNVQTNQRFYSMNSKSAEQHLLNIELNIINSIISRQIGFSLEDLVNVNQNKYTNYQITQIVNLLPQTYHSTYKELVRHDQIPLVATSAEFSQILIHLAELQAGYGGSGKYDFQTALKMMKKQNNT